jgi:uncharacterized membrane protein YkgB
MKPEGLPEKAGFFCYPPFLSFLYNTVENKKFLTDERKIKNRNTDKRPFK